MESETEHMLRHSLLPTVCARCSLQYLLSIVSRLTLTPSWISLQRILPEMNAFSPITIILELVWFEWVNIMWDYLVKTVFSVILHIFLESVGPNERCVKIINIGVSHYLCSSFQKLYFYNDLLRKILCYYKAHLKLMRKFGWHI